MASPILTDADIDAAGQNTPGALTDDDINKLSAPTPQASKPAGALSDDDIRKLAEPAKPPQEEVKATAPVLTDQEVAKAPEAQTLNDKVSVPKAKVDDSGLRALLAEDAANNPIRSVKPGESMGEVAAKAGERYPAGAMKTYEDLQLGKASPNPLSAIPDFWKNVMAPNPDERNATQIAQDIGKRVLPPAEIKDPDSKLEYWTTVGKEFIKNLPFTTAGALSENINPNNVLTMGLASKVPHADIPAPAWVDNAITGFINNFGAPFSSLNNMAKAKLTDSITNEIFDKVKPRMDELKQNFQDLYGREATDADIKAQIKAKLDRGGIGDQNVGQLATKLFGLKTQEPMAPVVQAPEKLPAPETPTGPAEAPKAPVPAPGPENAPIATPGPGQAQAPAPVIEPPSVLNAPVPQMQLINIKGKVPDDLKPVVDNAPALDENLRNKLDEMKEMLYMGENPQLIGLEGQQNKIRTPSTNPDFFQQLSKDWTKDRTIELLNKLSDGQPVTATQWARLSQMIDMYDKSPMKGFKYETLKPLLDQEAVNIVNSKDLTQSEVDEILQYANEAGQTQSTNLPATGGDFSAGEYTRQSSTANTSADYNKLIDSIHEAGGHIIRVSTDEWTGAHTIDYQVPTFAEKTPQPDLNQPEITPSGALRHELQAPVPGNLFQEKGELFEPPAGSKLSSESGQVLLPPAIDNAAAAAKEIIHLLSPKSFVPRESLDVIMKMKGERDKAEFEIEAKMKSLEDAFDKMPQDQQVAFINNIKTGKQQATPSLQAVADMMRKIEDAYHAEAKQYKPSLTYKENHFRVLWKVIPGSPEATGKAGFAGIFRRPLQGSKGFMKRSTLTDMSEGLERGGVPYSYNPVTMWRNAIMDMQKFITANRMFEALKAMDVIEYVPVGDSRPEGYVPLQDPMGMVYKSPEIPVNEYVDMVKYRKLNEVAKNFGLTHERKMNLRALGYAHKDSGLIETKFATPLGTLTHEIGHHLDWQFGLKEWFNAKKDAYKDNKKEIRALADLRYEGKEASPYYKKYVRKGEEKMANLVDAFVNAPELFQKTAPNTWKEFNKFIDDHPELEPLREIKPSLVREELPGKVHAGGVVNTGEYVIEENAGRVLNNFLSRDLMRESKIGKGLLGFKNFTTAIELSLSPFHASYVSLTAMSSSIGLGLQEMYNIGILQGKPEAFLTGLKDMISGLTGAAPVQYAAIGGNAIRMVGRENFINSKAGQDFIKAFPEAKQLLDDLFLGGGKLAIHQDYKINSLKAFQEGIKNKEPWAIAISALPAGGQMIMRPLFEIYIPRLKIGAFLKEYSMELAARNDQLQSGRLTRAQLAREVWSSVENRFGEMNFDNLFWNRTFKSALQLTFRSVTWKLGALQNIFGAGTGQIKDFAAAAQDGKAPLLNRNFAWLLGLSLMVVAFAEIFQRAMIGEGPKDWKDIMDPRYDKEGNRIFLNTHLKDWAHLFHSPGGFVSNSLAGWIGRALETWRNKDFYNVEIHHPGDPPVKQAWDMLKHNVPLPFSLTGQNQLKTQAAPTPVKLLTGAGLITPAPGYVTKTPAVQLAEELRSNKFPAGSRTADQFQHGQMKSKWAQQFAKDGDTKMLDEAVKEGTLTQKESNEIQKDAKLSPLSRDVKHFSYQEVAQVMEKANKDEIKELLPIFLDKINRKMDSALGGPKAPYQDLKNFKQKTLERFK